MFVDKGAGCGTRDVAEINMLFLFLAFHHSKVLVEVEVEGEVSILNYH